ncbi:hypothetical protein LTR70_001159 [Exophiala xenobiotica]|uniref:VOC domain-containing protein n=1 Tax=Lithohypha guttulata TaxID=1690604 RepID=A0ABR0K840_9EURO|nr:hypothetical protein LTR24_005744 [Lithohypha guttulata]KAK5328134.1 hypothetical protein LTR70_001159 [Exophiala xenobiotica]
MPSSITLTVKSLPQSTSFFLSALQPLDYVYRGRVDNTIGFGTKDSPPDFWISQETPGVAAGAAHVAFPAGSRTNVQDFFVAALKAGGKCHGEPLLRDPATGYYSAAIIDFDGNSIEAVFRPDLLDEGYGSRPSSVSSVSSAKSKPALSTKAPSMVSKANTARQSPTEVRSAASLHVSKATSKAPSQASRAPSSASKAPTSASRAPTQVSRAPTAAHSQISRAPSHISRAPTAVSRSQSYHSSAPAPPPPQQQPQVVQHTTPTGEVVTTIVNEARGALNIAKELVNHVRPALASANTAPNIHSSSPASDLNSHKPSDTIVGTLLGVAAGAALHYAYTKATEGDKKREDEFEAAKREAAYRPPVARTSTEPSYADERMYYYHEYNPTPVNHSYAIEAPPTEYGYSRYEPSRVGSQRYITMQDTDERLSDVAPSTVQPRRRSSFSGLDVRSFTSQSRASQNPASKSRMIEAPPTSYKAPTALTQVETEVQSRTSGRSRSRSMARSTMRSVSASGESRASRRSSRHASDEDLRSQAESHISRRTSMSKQVGSDEDLRSKAESRISRRTSASKQGTGSNEDLQSKVESRMSRRTSASKQGSSSGNRAPSVAPSERSDARTVVPIKVAPSAAPSKAPSQAASKAASRAPSKASTVRPEDRPLPASRAGTTVSASDYHSTHSKANKTVIGRMLEKDRGGSARSELTRSVVGKLEDTSRLNVPDREVDPSDSVSQVSSVRSKRSSRR